MKSTGIVRKVDELGRVVLPIELRRTLDIQEKDELEIVMENENIILTKYQDSKECDITGDISNDNRSFAGGKLTLSKKGAKELIHEITTQFDSE